MRFPDLLTPEKSPMEVDPNTMVILLEVTRISPNFLRSSEKNGIVFRSPGIELNWLPSMSESFLYKAMQVDSSKMSSDSLLESW